MPLRGFASKVTQSTFRQSKDHVRLKTLHRLFQSSIDCQRPDEIFIVGNPRGQPGAEPALSQSINKIRQPQRCMHKEVVSKVRIAGNVQFKRRALHQLPVHDDAHTAVVAGRHDAHEQNADFQPHQPEYAASLWEKMSVAGVLQISSYFCCSRKRCRSLEIASLTDGGSSHSTAIKRGRKRSQSWDSRTSSSIPSTSTDKKVSSLPGGM